MRTSWRSLQRMGPRCLVLLSLQSYATPCCPSLTVILTPDQPTYSPTHPLTHSLTHSLTPQDDGGPCMAGGGPSEEELRGPSQTVVRAHLPLHSLHHSTPCTCAVAQGQTLYEGASSCPLSNPLVPSLSHRPDPLYAGPSLPPVLTSQSTSPLTPGGQVRAVQRAQSALVPQRTHSCRRPRATRR